MTTPAPGALPQQIEEFAQLLARPALGTRLLPEQAMRLAISEAKRGLGFVAPNPHVGCVIVDKDHRFISSGFHRKVGLDHAEIEALNAVAPGISLEGAIVYVTLEPCAHEGRRPSCAKRLATLPVKRVIYGLCDPFDQVNGEGAAILKRAGIEAFAVEEMADWSEPMRKELINELEEVAEIFLWNVRSGRPFVAMKVASSLDGYMALTSGESKWITGDKARLFGHYLRAQYDAVVVGRTTLEADDPSLNIRIEGYTREKNRVVVLDPHGKTFPSLIESNLLKVRAATDVIVVTRAGVNKGLKFDTGVTHLNCAVDANERFVIDDLLVLLKAEGLTSLYIEGGAHTFSSFLQAGAMQRLHLFQAPLLLGGHHGHGWTESLRISEMSGQLALEDFSPPRLLGRDLYLTALLKGAR